MKNPQMTPEYICDADGRKIYEKGKPLIRCSKCFRERPHYGHGLCSRCFQSHPGGARVTAWTPEMDAQLRDLVRQGWRNSRIAERLSTTKNAVIGRRHRIGLIDNDWIDTTEARLKEWHDLLDTMLNVRTPTPEVRIIRAAIKAENLRAESAPPKK